jgi:ferrous iron transport protein B
MSKAARTTIALVGNPNTGKSTFFSALCGVPARVGNYPGVTVEKKLGYYADDQGEVTVVDLPGTYSLTARTLDEQVSVDVLLGNVPDVPRIDLIVAIIDATNLERNLYLYTQLRQLGLPILVVLNMWDRAQTEIDLDINQLQQRLGIPIVTATASRRVGIEEARQAIRHALKQPIPPAPEIFPTEFNKTVEQLREWLAQQGQQLSVFQIQRLILDTEGSYAQQLVQLKLITELPCQLSSARVQLLKHGLRVPSVETKSRYDWIRTSLAGIYKRHEKPASTSSDRIDRWLTHRIWGFVAFGAIMFLIYQAITLGAGWFADKIDGNLVPWVSGQIESWIGPGILRSLVVDGIVAGVGSVVVFLPVIAMLFFFVALLEDCGYMARAAFVMDKAMTKLGLSGKSFLPLMSSFACAVPGIMATRVIDNWRDRMVTIMIAPLMSCSARLPVYMLFISAFVPQKTWLGGWIGLQGIVLFGFTLVGLVVAIPVAWILKKLVFRGPPSAFVMELPSYKLPSVRVVFFRVWESGLSFLTQAGTLIFCTSVLVWAAGYFPGDHTKLHDLTRQIESLPEDEQSEVLVSERQAEASRLIESSLLGKVGKTIEPVVLPLGWDWRIGVGVIASFPAREVIIGTLGTIYSLGGDDDSNSGLKSAMQSASWPDGKPVFTLPVALSIMVFFALCAQCAATLMVIRRETNSWRWPVVAFVYMTTLAYVGALITYQVSLLLLA